MELFGLGRVCVRCRQLMTSEHCQTCRGDQGVTLTSDIYASARGIEAPALYDAADRGLSFALLVEMLILFVAAGAGSNLLATVVVCSMMATGGMLAWGLPAMRQRHRLRLVMKARARALPPARWSPELPGGSRSITGHAKRLKNQVSGPLSGTQCLVAAVDVVVREKLAFREVIAKDFLVVEDDGTLTIVAGDVWLEPGPSDLSMHTAEAELQVASVSMLPARFRPGGIAHETRIHDGDLITVRGRAAMEQHPDMVLSYRDPDVLVLRGEPGAPLSITKNLELHMMVY